MKKVDPNTTKNAVENYKVDGEVTIVLEDVKKYKLDRVSIASGLCGSSESTDFACNKSAPTILKQTDPVLEPNTMVAMYTPVDETDQTTPNPTK